VSDAIFSRLWDALDGADAVVLGLAFFCGLRREEITRLRIHNVDCGTRKLVNFVRKGGGEYTLPIGTMLDTFEQRLPHLGAERLWPLIAQRADAGDGDRLLIGWSDLGRPRRSVAASRREADQLDPAALEPLARPNDEAGERPARRSAPAPSQLRDEPATCRGARYRSRATC
jgi:integrase